METCIIEIPLEPSSTCLQTLVKFVPSSHIYGTFLECFMQNATLNVMHNIDAGKLRVNSKALKVKDEQLDSEVVLGSPERVVETLVSWRTVKRAAIL